MAAQPPVIARHALSAHLPRPRNVCNCGFIRTPSPHVCLHPERAQLVLKGITQSQVLSAGRASLRTFAVALSSLSDQTISERLEELKVTENDQLNDVLQESVLSSSTQTGNDRLLSQPEAASPSQEAPFALEAQPLDSSFSTSADAVPDVKPFNQSSDLTRPDPGASFDAITGADNAGTAADNSSSVSDSANTATDLVPGNQIKSAKEAYESMLSGGGRNSPEMDSDVSLSVSDVVSEVKSFISKVQDTVQDSINDTIQAAKSTYDNVNASILETVNGVSWQNGNSVSVVPKSADSSLDEGLSDILTSPFRIGTPVNNALKVVVTAVDNVTGKVFVAAGQLVSDGYSSAKGNLPVDVQLYLDDSEKKVTEISALVKPVLEQIYNIILDAEKSAGIDPENPVVPIILVFGGGLYLGVIYWQSRFGGYSGDLTPTSALELLRKEGNVVLVDIRPEDLRESEGIPDLRRQARFKIASVEPLKIQGSIQKMLKKATDAEANIIATVIKNLKNVQRNTKVIVMDADGSQSKSIARALKRSGIKMPYRIAGGFRAWGTDGLRVKRIGPETPLTIIQEETEAILDEVKPPPEAIVLVILGSFAGVYALIEWEKTLQLLGIICIGQVAYNRLSSYESAEDAKNDLKLLLRPFTWATQGILLAAGQLEPSKLQLATSPSTSAVQDRVLQAAAKHGPVLSESDQESPETQPSEDQVLLPSTTDDAIPEEE